MSSNTSMQAAENLARAYLEEQNWERAIVNLGYLMQSNEVPDDLKFMHAYSHLILGGYENGWLLFDEALQFIGDPNNPHGAQYLRTRLGKEKKWQGEKLHGKKLLIWSEHGLGDIIMMSRYIHLIPDRFGECSLEIWTPLQLVRLISENFPAQVEIVGREGLLEKTTFDYHTSIMSLPQVFETYRESAIPSETPYLGVPKSATDIWEERLRMYSELKIGLVWSGNSSNEIDKQRSIPLSAFATIIALKGAVFISLQKGDAVKQLDSKNCPIVNLMNQCSDMLDTASLVSNLDLVISVDTSIAHLAGALGCPVWLLNRNGSEWRWLIDRIDSPWYPTMRIFNQKNKESWDTVITQVTQELSLALARRGSEKPIFR
ncbi:MAG: hypothetical protein IPN06_19055 [Burkholderiales bacterium]|nr:hypothetical protein [Burkholderiales bacterium]